MDTPALSAPDGPAARGHLSENIAMFAHVLRDAGLPVGPAHAIDAVAALEAAGITRRDDVRAALASVFVHKREQMVVFDLAFDTFFRGRNLLDKMMELLSPVVEERRPEAKPQAGAARVAQAMRPPNESEARKPTELEIDATLTASSEEVLRSKDFAQMTTEELARAQEAVRALVFDADKLPSRRWVAAPRGKFEPRRSMRKAMRTGGEMISPAAVARQLRVPPVVALCDISGSMADYSRVVLHFLHALGEKRTVHTFLFGTRLSNVTRALSRRDPDEALAQCSAQVVDWSGGTRIGETLATFNKQWSRRVLSGGPIVLLVTDGLERDGSPERLAREADRLHRSCRELIFLNPLLRYEGFEPKAEGIRALLPNVDRMITIHSVDSVAALVSTLGMRNRRQT